MKTLSKLPISERAKKIDASGIRKVFELAAKRRQEGKEIVDLSIGQPDFPVPERVKQAAIEAIKANKNSYTVTQGIDELRYKVKENIHKNISKEIEEVIITSGVSGGLVLALFATCQTGDEVIIIDPYFVMYKHLVNLTGATPIIIDSYPDFNLPLDKIKDAITERTCLIIINSPSNPTGCIYKEEQLKELAELAEKYNLVIISDEIYSKLCYDNTPVSIGRFAPHRTIIIDGFSKSLAMTGWRVGWAAGPKEIIEQMAKLQQYTFVCAPSPFQYAAVEFENIELDNIVEEYKRRRNLIYEGLKEKFQPVRPEGGFYIFPRVPSSYSSATEFCQKALEKGVLIIPGSVFSEHDTHFRISYARDLKTLERGVNLLNELAQDQ